MSEECVICSKPYEGYGHNARPLADGRCCDACNTLVIIKRLQNALNLNRKFDAQDYEDEVLAWSETKTL